MLFFAVYFLTNFFPQVANFDADISVISVIFLWWFNCRLKC